MEGLDQYRGWFQSALLTAVGAFGQGAPFKAVSYTHLAVSSWGHQYTGLKPL